MLHDVVGTCAPEEEMAPKVLFRCVAVPRGDERNAVITLSLRASSKVGRTRRAPSAYFAGMTLGYGHLQYGHRADETRRGGHLEIQGSRCFVIASRGRRERVSKGSRDEEDAYIRSRVHPPKPAGVKAQTRKISGGWVGKGRQQASGASNNIDGSAEAEEVEEKNRGKRTNI